MSSLDSERLRARRLRVLFVLNKAGHLRKFEAGLRGMLLRGLDVHLALPRSQETTQRAVIDRLAARFPSLHVTMDAPTVSVLWPFRVLAAWCRFALRDLHRAIVDKTSNRPRDRRRPHHPIHRLFQRWAGRRPWAVRFVRGMIAMVERITPPSAAVMEYLRRDRPDVLIVSPLLHVPFLTDYVRAAARLKIPSALAVASWDNLTTKGPLLALPDYMIVWNDVQRREAWLEHRFPPIDVVVTGAHAFDDWFHARPRAREEWCGPLGLDPNSPYVLYLCSSVSIAGDETGLVDRWLDALRNAGDPRIRQLQVMIRPHPQNGSIWRHWRTEWPAVVVSPPQGEDPVEARAKADFFDAMFHSLAVVGLNTSALIEAGIVGRPVLTVLASEQGQERTPHFHHLVEGGLLRTAGTFAEHHEQLLDVMHTQGAMTVGQQKFLTSFVRPYGLEWEAGALFGAAIEPMVVDGCTERGRSALDWLIAPVAWPLVILFSLLVGPFMRSPRSGSSACL